MSKYLFLLTCFLVASAPRAQIIDNGSCSFLSDEPFFSEEFIRQNNIYKITGNYSIKADLDRIRPSDKIYEYIFNEEGKLVTKWLTFVSANKGADTSITMYEYDNKGKVKVIRKSDSYGFYSYHYEYDEKGRITYEEYRRDLSSKHRKDSFELDKSFVVSGEKSTYEDFGKQVKRTYYNNLGKPYQYRIYYYDEYGYLTEEYIQLIINTGYQKIYYEYDSKGRPVKKTVESRMVTPTETIYEYEYDEQGNILSQQMYRNGKHAEDVQVVYSWQTHLLKAFLTREVDTNYITILRFDFDYFTNTTQRIKD